MWCLTEGQPLVTLSSLSPWGPTCEGAAELLEVSQDLLAQEVDETGDNLWDSHQDRSLSQRHDSTPKRTWDALLVSLRGADTTPTAPRGSQRTSLKGADLSPPPALTITLIL